MVTQMGADDPPENGKHVEYYENGNKKSEAHYKNGKMDGFYAMWWRSFRAYLKVLEQHLSMPLTPLFLLRNLCFLDQFE